jgi:hypothetical protein
VTKQAVLKIVDLPPILGPVKSITFLFNYISFGMKSNLVKHGCLAFTILYPFSIKHGLLASD